MVLFAVLVIAAGIWTIEGTLADSPSRDVSKDTSDEDSDSVFKSINPLESAIMPVSRTRLTDHDNHSSRWALAIDVYKRGSDP